MTTEPSWAERVYTWFYSPCSRLNTRITSASSSLQGCNPLPSLPSLTALDRALYIVTQSMIAYCLWVWKQQPSSSSRSIISSSSLGSGEDPGHRNFHFLLTCSSGLGSFSGFAQWCSGTSLSGSSCVLALNYVFSDPVLVAQNGGSVHSVASGKSCKSGISPSCSPNSQPASNYTFTSTPLYKSTPFPLQVLCSAVSSIWNDSLSFLHTGSI